MSTRVNDWMKIENRTADWTLSWELPKCTADKTVQSVCLMFQSMPKQLYNSPSIYFWYACVCVVAHADTCGFTCVWVMCVQKPEVTARSSVPVRHRLYSGGVFVHRADCSSSSGQPACSSKFSLPSALAQGAMVLWNSQTPFRIESWGCIAINIMLKWVGQNGNKTCHWSQNACIALHHKDH